MKTILHVIDTTGPGGAETIYTQLANETSIKGYSSFATIRGSGWVEQQLIQLKIPYQIIDCKGSFNLKYLLSLIKIIRSKKIDIIQSHLLGSNVYCSLAGLLTQTPVISTFHGSVDISPSEKFRTLKLLILRFGSTKIVTVTDQINMLVKNLPYIKKPQVRTIYNGIDISAYTNIDATKFRENLSIPKDAIIIGSLGNIRKPKNYPLAIEAIHTLHQRNIPAYYLIAGQGNDKQKEPLLALIQKYNLSKHVHLLGFTKDTQLFLSSLNIFLMTSSSEGHPLALTQAMANRAPIVSTPSGVEEIINANEEALITNTHTADEIAKNITLLLNDKNKMDIFTEKAFNKADHNFSLTAMFNSYLNLYSKYL